jgi:hypothetical protein
MLHHAKTRTYLTRRRAEQKNLAAASTLAVLAEGIYLDPQDGAILEGPAALAMAQRELAKL